MAVILDIVVEVDGGEAVLSLDLTDFFSEEEVNEMERHLGNEFDRETILKILKSKKATKNKKLRDALKKWLILLWATNNLFHKDTNN